jgi:hypothetical protein
MYPDLYLEVERVRAQELRAEADRHRLAARCRSAARTSAPVWRRRLGWALVEIGLRLVGPRAGEPRGRAGAAWP